MPDVRCRRCGQTKPGLTDPPLPADWGAAIVSQTCADCWREWSQEQTRIINHLGLQVFKPADKRVLYRNLHDYLHLEGVERPPE